MVNIMLECCSRIAFKQEQHTLKQQDSQTHSVVSFVVIILIVIIYIQSLLEDSDHGKIPLMIDIFSNAFVAFRLPTLCLDSLGMGSKDTKHFSFGTNFVAWKSTFSIGSTNQNVDSGFFVNTALVLVASFVWFVRMDG